MNKQILTTLLILTLLLTQGCISSNPNTLNQAYYNYEIGQYQASLNIALKLSNPRNGYDDDDFEKSNNHEAAYLAGISAYRLNRFAQAKEYLQIAENSPNATLSGDAKAQYGLICLGDGDYAQAKLKLDQAASLLTGVSRENAKIKADTASTLLNMSKRKRTTNSSYPSPNKLATAKNGYTLQLGAFKVKNSALNIASTYSHKSRSLGYGQPWVKYDTTKKLYRVRLGHFKNMQSAVTARRRIGVNVCTVMDY